MQSGWDKMRFIIFILFLGIHLYGVTLTLKEKQFLEQHGPITVSNEKDWKPYDFNEDGVAKGFSIDFVNLIAKKVGIEVHYLSGKTWTDYMEMIQNKKLDVILNIAKTPERNKYLVYTNKYFTKIDTIFIHKDNKAVQSLKDLEGKKLAVVHGYYEEEILKRLYPKINLHIVPNSTESFKAVAFKEVYAVMNDVGVGSSIINNFNLEGIVPSCLVSDKELSLDLHLATHKDNVILRDILQKGYNEITEEELHTLRKKWLLLGEKEDTFDYELFIEVVIIVLLLLALLLYRNNVLKKYNLNLKNAGIELANEAKEKEILFQELDHRVKNNLQIISSIVSLHSLKDDTSQALEDINNTISAIALAHDKLHQNSIHNTLELNNYISVLLDNLLSSSILEIEKEVHSPLIYLNAQQSITLGLIINEFVSNSIKYAFDGISTPKISVDIKENGDLLTVVISDNGIGFQEDKQSSGLGMEIIKTLAKSKFKTDVQFFHNNGTFLELKIALK
jgi:two-component sensor histidine kinase